MPASSLTIVFCLAARIQAFSIGSSAAKKATVSCKMIAHNNQRLPKLYSTIDEIDNHLQKRGCSSTSQNDNGGEKSDGCGSSTNCNDEEGRHPVNWAELPHLFLHFDINETILIGDPAGGDTVEECLNKIIAKSAFVSTTNGEGGNRVVGGNGEGCKGKNNQEEGEEARIKRSPSSGDISTTGTHHLEPANWWNGVALLSTSGRRTPPPLYTGWTWPPQTCPYYRTSYKRLAKQFTNNPHGVIYRPLYDVLCSKIGLDDQLDGEKTEGGEQQTTANEGIGEGGKEDTFRNFLPAFYHTLQHYFPSTSSCGSNSNNSNENDNNTNEKLPLPAKVTLVLRTFGTDLPRVAKVISAFAKGEHPSYPNYYNADLILDGGDLYKGGWTYGESTVTTLPILRYELHQSATDVKNKSISSSSSGSAIHSGDDKVLDYLQSKTVVGIQDDYPFWRDRNHAPWAGKPVWVTEGQRNHHHILLDDNIHNDPYDGAGGVRILSQLRVPGQSYMNDIGETIVTEETILSYDSLRGNEALAMHGKHLIRVPTIRPLLEDDWFIKQIEEARWRVYLEERENSKYS